MYSTPSLIPARRNLPFCQILSFEHKHTQCLSYYMLNHIKIKYPVTNGPMKVENDSVHHELICCTFINLENFHFHFAFCFFCVNYWFCTLSLLSPYSFCGMGEKWHWKKKCKTWVNCFNPIAPKLFWHLTVKIQWIFKLIFHITLSCVNKVI